MANDRYFVDLRSGCVAVRDRENTDGEYNGLHEDTPGVMQYWDGHRKEKKCTECGHMRFAGWEVWDEEKDAAEDLCKELNERNDNDGRV